MCILCYPLELKIKTLICEQVKETQDYVFTLPIY